MRAFSQQQAVPFDQRDIGNFGILEFSLMFICLSNFFPGIVLGPGTHVEEPVLANGMLEVSTYFVKISRIAEQVLWNEDKVF